ncbi:MAG: FHA domain-containing protein [Planctomycetes bacterium]|jgi:pSer/pThr/pTyr-binding forkhead associated (FHA) protein|nr:FHA domain-containing protein [Planctomycetota bacterium]
MFRVTLSLAGRPIQHYNFDQDTVCIGRDPDCEIPIDNIGVSRRHATIERADGKYVLTDLKSHNGIFVQGRRVFQHPLSAREDFFIGKYSITFEDLDSKQEMPTTVVDLVAPKKSQAMQDMTFQLDRDEIEKLVNASTAARAPKLAQIAPAGENATLVLDRFYYLLGSSDRAAVRLKGFRMPKFVAALVRNDKWFHVVALTTRAVIVNGMPVTDHQLSDGDVIQIGRRKYRFARG